MRNTHRTRIAEFIETPVGWGMLWAIPSGLLVSIRHIGVDSPGDLLAAFDAVDIGILLLFFVIAVATGYYAGIAEGEIDG